MINTLEVETLHQLHILGTWKCQCADSRSFSSVCCFVSCTCIQLGLKVQLSFVSCVGKIVFLNFPGITVSQNSSPNCLQTVF